MKPRTEAALRTVGGVCKALLIVVAIMIGAGLLIRGVTFVQAQVAESQRDYKPEVIALCEKIIKQKVPAASVIGSAAFGSKDDGWMVTGTINLLGETAQYTCNAEVKGEDLVAEISHVG